jgi:hypothetical protein
LVIVDISAVNAGDIGSMAVGWITSAEKDTPSSWGVAVNMGLLVRAVSQTSWKLWLTISGIGNAVAGI